MNPTSRAVRQHLFLSGCQSILAASILALSACFSSSAFAYENYTDGCDNGACHGGFRENGYISNTDNTSWQMDLMDGHLEFITGNDDCDTCHTGPGFGTALLNSSDSTDKPQGCVGCHGREGDENGLCAFGMPDNDNEHCGSAAGLRKQHEAAGVSCWGCHSSENGSLILVGEDEAPFNYGRAGIELSSPCVDENKFGPTGLDNDGDGVIDAADADCAPPLLRKVVGLADVNANTFPDLAVIREGSIIAEIRDGELGALLGNITFLDDGFTPITAAALPDSDGNGVAELAVLATRNSDGRIVVELRNVTGNEMPRQVWFASNHTAVAMAIVASDADGNGVAELAVLSTRNSDGRGLVEVKNAFGATNPQALWAGAGLTPNDVDVIEDADSNNIPEIGILSTRDSDGRIVVEIKNAAGPVLPNAVWFAPGHTAVDLTVVNDADNNGIPEVAVLSARNSDGRLLVEVKNASGPTLSNAVWFAPGHTALSVESVNDADSNTVPEIAVLSSRDSDGRVLVEVKNAAGPTNLHAIWYSPGFEARSLTILDDADGNTIEEAAVLLIRNSDDRILVQSRNASGSLTQTDYWFSP